VAVAALLAATAAPAHADDTLRVAVIPDTQTETYRQAATRARWIAAQDVDVVAHVGDVTNWGARVWRQFRDARRWMRLLPVVPRAVAVGNHDTAAVGVGGSAYDPPNTGRLLRDTRAFNRARLVPRIDGAYEPGKTDNSWTRINPQWAMLTLELWPRPAAVAWAAQVIRSQPDTRWIVVTHSCLNRRGQITNGRSYGSTSPAYLRDQLVRPNRNLRVVLCGHIGRTAETRDRHTLWVLTNATRPGVTRMLTITGDQVRTWVR
jgi:hypothetical protein